MMIAAHQLSRHYKLGSSLIRALDGVNFQIEQGEFVCIVGASGSGKSTLLNLLAGLDRPTTGSIITPIGDLDRMTPKQLAAYRAQDVGLIFQSFNLIPHQTALTNVETALLFSPDTKKQRSAKSIAILEKIGLGDRLHHRPDDLSGGEQQRVAVARALVKNPKVLLADEPTGNLDRENSRNITELISEWNHREGTVVMVTHNVELAKHYAHRVLIMEYGKFSSDQAAPGVDDAV